MSLPEPWQERFEDGKLNTALLLGTVFSEKYQGRNMQPGEVADIALPAPGGRSSRRLPRLLLRAGSREATPFVWLGDSEAGDRTLYVAFGPLRKKRQFLKIVHSGSTLVEDVIQIGQLAPGASSGETQAIRISAYIKRLLDKLWDRDNFGERLARVVADHPGHQVLFAGISHGAVLAQAAALRFGLQAFGSDVTAATWNGYKWTDEQGSALVGRHVDLLPLVLSRRDRPDEQRRWDSVAEFPAGFAPMPAVLLMDADTGRFVSGEGRNKLGEASLGPRFACRMAELHFAKTALKAMKFALAATFDIRGRNSNGGVKLSACAEEAIPKGKASEADGAVGGPLSQSSTEAPSVELTPEDSFLTARDSSGEEDEEDEGYESE